MQIYLFIACFLCCFVAFYEYLPGAPVQYLKGQNIKMKIEMTTFRNQPEYYSLQFCLNETMIDDSWNLGDALRGVSVVNTPYEARMAVNTSCKLLCTNGIQSSTLDSNESNNLIKLIQDEYLVYL